MTSKTTRVFVVGEHQIDPLDIFYTHSKIRPIFSGCGKRIVDTIAEIESGKIAVTDLPQVSVIQSPEGHTFCMNNRRLYVLKHIRRLGLLGPENTVSVRVKKALPRELAKFSPEKCSLNCVMLREKVELKSDSATSNLEEHHEEDIVDGLPENNTSGTSDGLSLPITSSGLPDTSTSVRGKNDKKKFQSTVEESDEAKYFRQKQKIAEAQELFKIQAAERLKQKLAKEQSSSLTSEGADDSASDSDEEDEEDNGDDELFVCELCSKDFRSVEQIEQHFHTKAHRRAVQDEFKRKREAEQRAAKRAAKKNAKANKASITTAVDTNGETLPPPPQPLSLDSDVADHQQEAATLKEDSSSNHSASNSESEESEDDDSFVSSFQALASKRVQQGLPTFVEGDSD